MSLDSNKPDTDGKKGPPPKANNLSGLRDKAPVRKPPEKQQNTAVNAWRRNLKELAPVLASNLEGLSDTDLTALTETAFVEKAGGNILAKAVYKDLRAQAAFDRDVAFPPAQTRSKRVTLTCRNPNLALDVSGPVLRTNASAKPESVLSEFAQYKGGIRGFDEEGVEVIYYVGIIDTLIEYNLKKKMERGYKANIKGLDPAAFSVVEPPLYAQRLLSFIVPRIK